MSHNRSPHSSDGHRADRPIRVLHVDDDESFVDLTADFLPRVNDRLTVHSELTAGRVLARLASESFDCVVSDFEMPELDGLALLRAVRDACPDLPFILFTGKGSETVAADAISAGVSDYLQKGGADRYDLLANRIITHVEKFWIEQELVHTRHRYERVGRVTADAFFEWEPQTDHVWRSPGYGRVFGYDVDEVPVSVDWWMDRIHPNDVDRVRTTFDETLAGGDERYEDTYRILFGDGSYGSVSVRGHVEYRDGEPTCVTGALTDVTDYVAKEHELQRAHERLDLALRGTNTGVWHWDIDTDEVVWDPTTVDIFGLGTDSPTTRQAYVDRIHPLDVDRVRATIANTLETGDSYDVKHRLKPDSDGAVRWIHGLGSVVFDDGEPVRMIGLVRDVTDQRQAEAELQRQNERLDEFASAVSHDLRGPLSVASGYLEMVDPADEDSAEALERVSRAHDRMNSLITDLLTLARQGASIDALAPVSLRSVAQRAWSMVDTGDATLSVEDDLLLWADEPRLGQVFENLFSNAASHAADADGQVSVVVGPLTDRTDGFFVADDGPGVPLTHRESVFKTGFTSRSGGTGFGLAIVSRIVEAHGWDVALTTSDAGGARFEFTGITVAERGVRGTGGSDETDPDSSDSAQGRGGAPS